MSNVVRFVSGTYNSFNKMTHGITHGFEIWESFLSLFGNSFSAFRNSEPSQGTSPSPPASSPPHPRPSCLKRSVCPWPPKKRMIVLGALVLDVPVFPSLLHHLA